MPNTRRVHVVRIKNPANKDQWIDVKVLDAMGLLAANGQEHAYLVDAAKATPYIVDNTGGGSTIGQADGATRVSHMKRIFGGDMNSYLDVEILDAIALLGPNGQEWAMIVPQASASVAVTDTTGNNLQTEASQTTTRADHIVMILPGQPKTVDGTTYVSSVSTEDPNWSQEQANVNTKGEKLIVERTDAIAFQIPLIPSAIPLTNQKGKADDPALADDPELNQQNGATALLWEFPVSESTENDTTQYTLDAAGNKVPPDNHDPNTYIRWPNASQNGGSVGQAPWLGNDPSSVLKQGPLWWVVKAGESSKGSGFGIFMNVTYTLTIDIAGILGMEQQGANYWVQLVADVGSPSMFAISGQQSFTIPDGPFSGSFSFSLDMIPAGANVSLYVYSDQDFGLSVNGGGVNTGFHATVSLTVIDASPPINLNSAVSPNASTVPPIYSGDAGDLYGGPIFDPPPTPYSLSVCGIGIDWGGNSPGTDTNGNPQSVFIPAGTAIIGPSTVNIFTG